MGFEADIKMDMSCYARWGGGELVTPEYHHEVIRALEHIK